MSKYSEKHVTKIDSLSHDGRGIARIHNKATFIFGALPGEEIEFRYVKFHRQFDEGIALNVLKPSALRTKPRCEFFGVCGGCSLQHMQAEEQVRFKEAVLIERIEHLSETKTKEILPPLQDDIWGYRNRARLSVHFVPKKNKAIVGFREQNSHLVADISRCEVLAPVIGDKIAALSELIFSLEAKAQIPQIEISVTHEFCALVIRHLCMLSKSDLNKIEAFATEHKFVIYLQPQGPQSIHLFYSKNKNIKLKYLIPHHNIQIQFQPLQFTQINPRINVKMIDRTIELLDLQKEDRVLDLFCGIGNFTLPIARYCQSVVGVEGDSDAVIQARKNAEFNQIQNAEFFTANLFEKADEEPWAQRRYDKILLDPPRAGAKEIVPLIKRFQAARIVYVSCHSATLARDIKLLTELGYTLEKVGVMDMFPHTQHAEAIALLRRK